MKSLLQDCKILKIEDSTGSATQATISDVVDMKGYGGVCFIYKLGVVTDAAVATLTVAQGTTTSPTDVLSGASATLTGSSDSEQSLVIDIVKPRERYVRATMTIITQAAGIDSGFAILYNPIAKPVSQPTTIDASTQVVSPAES